MPSASIAASSPPEDLDALCAGRHPAAGELKFALGGRVDSGADGVRIHAGLVELRAEDDATVFRERAEAALERAKQAATDCLSAAQ
jgi:hypothetical protein